MRKLMLLISMLVISLVVVSCAPKMSDEELEVELSKLSPGELEAVTAEDSGTFAGMAKANPNLVRLQRAYKKTSSTCSDNDEDVKYSPSSKNPYQKGTITWTLGSSTGGTVDDVCVVEGGDELRENYCQNNVRGTELIICSKIGPKQFPGSSNWKCMNGACVGEGVPAQMESVEATKPEQMEPVESTPKQMGPVGAQCEENADCQSNNCDNGVCA